MYTNYPHLELSKSQIKSKFDVLAFHSFPSVGMLATINHFKAKSMAYAKGFMKST